MLNQRISLYQATIFGQVDSPFEGSIYLLDVQFPVEYPFKPPKVTFFTKIFHPNIDVNRNIYMNIFYDQWTPMLSIEKVLLTIQSLLTLPEVNVLSRGNKEAARLYMQDRDKYDEYVRLYTQKYVL
jgi:ubiquitin-conjugating enzyme E2 D/E